ncbi:MAG: RagB/SusD family nutrient uptake outer membrane protein [Gemmatimonadaceae bacterium]
MMKRLSLTALALTFALAGCKEMLTETPKNFLTTDSYYRTPADIEAATLSAYQPLRDGNVWNRWLLWDVEMGSDVTRINPDEPNFGTYHPGLLLWTPTDGSVVNPWNGLYASIFRANLVLGNASNVTFPNATLQKQLVAEAKFVRAYDYLMLTKAYDDVPLLLTLEDHSAAASKSRTAVEQIHQQLIKDLTEAEADLPDAPTQLGRASKGAAQMVLADLYQWRSSFLKKSEWTQSSAAAKKVIDNARWGLTDDFLAAFLPANKGNKEIIWLLVSSGIDGRSSSDPGCNWLPRELGFGSAGGCEVVGQPTKWHYESYLCSTPDPLTFNASGRIADTTKVKTCDYRKQVSYRHGGCSASSAIGCIVFKWPNLYKFRPTNRGIGGPSDVDFPLYRYAEAMLIYAEAQNELGNSAVAVAVINQLRARARKADGVTPLAEPHDYGTKAGEAIDKLSVREAIYQERNWETAGEGKRWFDQVRRNSLEPGYWKTTLTRNDPETATRGDLSEFRMRYPIPAPERLLNTNLTQNPGY